MDGYNMEKNPQSFFTLFYPLVISQLDPLSNQWPIFFVVSLVFQHNWQGRVVLIYWRVPLYLLGITIDGNLIHRRTILRWATSWSWTIGAPQVNLCVPKPSPSDRMNNHKSLSNLCLTHPSLSHFFDDFDLLPRLSLSNLSLWNLKLCPSLGLAQLIFPGFGALAPHFVHCRTALEEQWWELKRFLDQISMIWTSNSYMNTYEYDSWPWPNLLVLVCFSDSWRIHSTDMTWVWRFPKLGGPPNHPLKK